MNKFLKGQTIVEMLVVLGVMGVLFSLVTTFSRAGAIEGQVMRQADRLIQDIRRVQDIAYLSQEYDGRIACGYGINFKTESYEVVVADSSLGDCSNISSYIFLPAEKISSYRVSTELPVRIQAVSNDLLFFTPPEPKTYFINTPAPAVTLEPPLEAATLHVELGAGGITYIVKINQFGGLSLD